jgi:kinesin family protein 5
MNGFNGTIMAYGQTNAGKTFSMEGLSLWDTSTQGVIPRCINTIFSEIAKSDSVIQYEIILSYFEIYNEKIRDLLNPSAVNMKLREISVNNFTIQDITEVYCIDYESILRVIEVGKMNRITATTLMNAESSRSHSIISITIQQKNLSTERNKKSKLYLIDLAGSEKVSKTHAR